MVCVCVCINLIKYYRDVIETEICIFNVPPTDLQQQRDAITSVRSLHRGMFPSPC